MGLQVTLRLPFPLAYEYRVENWMIDGDEPALPWQVAYRALTRANVSNVDMVTV
jgi:hypothetical protein